MKPNALEINVDSIPDAMTSRDQWVNWKYEWRCFCDDNDHREECSEGEWSKAPYQSSGRNYAKSNDSDTWSTFDEAIEAYEDGRVDGLGFVFDGDLVGFDFDDCRDPDQPHGSVPDLVQEQIKDLESYTELSPSKTGYHTIVKGELPEGYEGNRNDLPCNPVRDDWDTPHLEVYDESSPRYFTVTGDSIHEEVDSVPQTVEERQELVEEVHETWIAEEEEEEDVTVSQNVSDLDIDDEELLEKARNATDGDYFADLYNGNWERHTHRWRGDSHSEARMAFAMKLAFWCQGDTARMTRLFKQSGLIRDQDDIRKFENYEAPKAARRVTEYYVPAKRPQYPVVDDIELRLKPINGSEVRVEIYQNGQKEHEEDRDRGFWSSAATRSRLAGSVADVLTGVDEDELKNGIKSALTQVSMDSNKEWFIDAMRTHRVQDLRDRTESVVCYPHADGSEWKVTMHPPDETPSEEPSELTFDEGAINNYNPDVFNTAYLGKFHTKSYLDSKEWSNLTDYWLEIQDIKKAETDNRLEAALEKFVDSVSQMQVWGDEEGFDWSSRNGYYAENYADGTDAILVPGRWVMDWQHDEGYDDINLSKELRNRDIMVDTSRRKSIDGKRRRAWPINAEHTSHTPDNVHRVVDDDDAPEGLQ